MLDDASLARRLVVPVVAAVVTAGCTAGNAGPGSDETAATAPAGVAGCESFAADGATAAAGDALPALRLACLTGGAALTMDDLGNRPVLVNLWASWCAPCREEMPMLQQAYERSGERIGFLGVDTEDPRSAAVSFLEDFGVTYAHVVDPDKKLLTALAVPGLPVTLAVGADGRILDRQIGQMSAARLDELVAELEAAVPADAPR